MLLASLALLALQPAVDKTFCEGPSGILDALLSRSGGDGARGPGAGGGGGSTERDWGEVLRQSCAVCVASVGVLVVTGIVSPTRLSAMQCSAVQCRAGQGKCSF